MDTTYTIKQQHIRAIIARALKCHESEVQLTADGNEDIEATITTDDPKAPGRADDMFKRWEKAAVSNPATN